MTGPSAKATGPGTEHDLLLQQAISAARSVTWRDSEDDLKAEREATASYLGLCSRQGLTPLPIEVH